MATRRRPPRRETYERAIERTLMAAQELARRLQAVMRLPPDGYNPEPNDYHQSQIWRWFSADTEGFLWALGRYIDGVSGEMDEIRPAAARGR